jgi:outer membrane cobalamin receptor
MIWWEPTAILNLQPETHRAEELGLVYNVSNALMRVVYFQTQTQNTIAYDSQYKPQNTGEMSNKGLELSTRSQIWGNQVKGALVLQDPWNVTGGFLPGPTCQAVWFFGCVARLERL